MLDKTHVSLAALGPGTRTDGMILWVYAHHYLGAPAHKKKGCKCAIKGLKGVHTCLNKCNVPQPMAHQTGKCIRWHEPHCSVLIHQSHCALSSRSLSHDALQPLSLQLMAPVGLVTTYPSHGQEPTAMPHRAGRHWPSASWPANALLPTLYFYNMQKFQKWLQQNFRMTPKMAW